MHALDAPRRELPAEARAARGVSEAVDPGVHLRRRHQTHGRQARRPALAKDCGLPSSSLVALPLPLPALAVALLLATALVEPLLLAALAVALLLPAALLAVAVPLTALLLAALAVALLLAAALLLAVALAAGGVEAGLLVGVVPCAGLVSGEPGLLLGVEMLLVAPVLQLLRVDPQPAEHPSVLLGVDLAHTLQLLSGLLVVTTELTNQVHDRGRVEVHGTAFPLWWVRYRSSWHPGR